MAYLRLYGILCFSDREALTDKEGNVHMLCDRKIKVTVNDLGYLWAIGSGNSLTEESYSDQEYASYYGRLQAVIAGRDRAGKVKVVLTAKDVVILMIEITVKEFSCIWSRFS